MTRRIYAVLHGKIHEVSFAPLEGKIKALGLAGRAGRDMEGRLASVLLSYAIDGGVVSFSPPILARQPSAQADLAAAIAILHGSARISLPQDVYAAGEVALDKRILPGGSGLLSAEAARIAGAPYLLLAPDDAPSAAISTLPIIPCPTLGAAILAAQAPDTTPRQVCTQTPQPAPSLDFADVIGQDTAKTAIAIAVGGGHGALFVGPPGAGKTMLAARMPSIMPPLSRDEAIAVTAIYDMAGLQCHPTQRPFRAPHHTASPQALLGGGTGGLFIPGEVSLASHGILYLDEMPEFRADTLEALREPLEAGAVHLSRAAGKASLPAKFTLIGSMNPCPCGYHGFEGRACACTPREVDRYTSHISGPLRDRLDMHVHVNRISMSDIAATDATPITSADLRAAIARMTDMRERRGQTLPNSSLPLAALEESLALTESQRQRVAALADRYLSTARGWVKILRIARSVADFYETQTITYPHILRALCYRTAAPEAELAERAAEAEEYAAQSVPF